MQLRHPLHDRGERISKVESRRESIVGAIVVPVHLRQRQRLPAQIVDQPQSCMAYEQQGFRDPLSFLEIVPSRSRLPADFPGSKAAPPAAPAEMSFPVGTDNHALGCGPGSVLHASRSSVEHERARCCRHLRMRRTRHPPLPAGTPCSCARPLDAANRRNACVDRSRGCVPSPSASARVAGRGSCRTA